MQHYYLATTAKAACGQPPATRTNPGAHGWLLRQAQRMDVAKGQGMLRQLALQAASPKAPMPPQPPAVDYRSVTGLRAVGFSPARHVRYILGRPVCVRRLSKGGCISVRRVTRSLPPWRQ